MAYVLGLDMGVASIGWSLIDDSEKKIITAGTRIFQAGVNVQPTGKEESRNVKRREARQIRRQIFRKHQRRDLLKLVFQKIGWLPEGEDFVNQIFKLNPYELRRKALYEELTLPELARVFYHLSKRRGFKSSRKAGANEEGIIFKGSDGKMGVTDLKQKMKDSDSKTIGEYFDKIQKGEVDGEDETKVRGKHFTLRDMYLEEFDTIWEIQVEFNPDIQKPMLYESMLRIKEICSEQQRDKWMHKDFYQFLKDYVMYYQRPLKSQKGLVGNCTLEPKSKKAPMSSLLFQEFRIWDKLHSFRITGPDRNDTPLTLKEKQTAFEKLNGSKEQTVEQIMKLLKLENYNHNFSLKKGEDKIKGNRTAHALMAVFGKVNWINLDFAEREKRWKIIYDAEDNKFLVEYGIEKWGLSPEQAEKLKDVSLESKYGNISQKAIKKILPFMVEQNLDYSKACVEAGYDHSQSNNHSKGTYQLLDEKKVPKLRNPIAEQPLHELRKIVNKLITEYRTPDIIRIELARELKMPKKKREAILLDNKARERENDRVTNRLREDCGLVNVSSEDIIKYKLWEECNHICPYTGENIGKSQLFGGLYEVEHIIPFSRSLDDSIQNKTLCHVYFNKMKGNYTPFEMDKVGKIDEYNRLYKTNITYDAIVERAKKLMRGKTDTYSGEFNYKKYKKFIQQTVNSDMVAQQLNDTAYMSLQARAYLETICKKVQVSKGGATATLRRNWGLNRLLNKFDMNIKTREDHRHHTLDAIVVACTTPTMLQSISTLHQKGIKPDPKLFPKPWDGFRNDVEQSLNEVLVAHRKKQRVRGQLHEESMFGKVKTLDGTDKTDEKGLSYFTIRKDLASLTPAMIMKVAEPARSIILERLASLGVDISAKKIKEIPPETFKEPLYMPNNKKNPKSLPNIIKKVRVHDVGSNKIEVRKGVFMDSGNNHHIVIFQKPDGKRDGIVVSLFEATKRKKLKQPIINTDCGAENEFVMSLATNDMVLIDDENFKTAEINWQNVDKTILSERLYRVQKMDISQTITFRHHLVAVLKNEEGVEEGRVFAKPNTFKGIKVIINEIGEIRPV
jgi:CRISPR-associated endonuclease Csn1